MQSALDLIKGMQYDRERANLLAEDRHKSLENKLQAMSEELHAVRTDSETMSKELQAVRKDSEKEISALVSENAVLQQRVLDLQNSSEVHDELIRGLEIQCDSQSVELATVKNKMDNIIISVVEKDILINISEILKLCWEACEEAFRELNPQTGTFEYKDVSSSLSLCTVLDVNLVRTCYISFTRPERHDKCHPSLGQLTKISLDQYTKVLRRQIDTDNFSTSYERIRNLTTEAVSFNSDTASVRVLVDLFLKNAQDCSSKYKIIDKIKDLIVADMNKK
ncbi:Lama2 [Acrasis kona]|uniref:Lama2 n=1 Tax=Acrasis kona TaxID=1008807 RepID=A0AAW2ZHV6_9EUKA